MKLDNSSYTNTAKCLFLIFYCKMFIAHCTTLYQLHSTKQYNPLHYTALNCTILHYTAHYNYAMNFTALHRIALHSTRVQCTTQHNFPFSLHSHQIIRTKLGGHISAQNFLASPHFTPLLQGTFLQFYNFTTL